MIWPSLSYSSIRKTLLKNKEEGLDHFVLRHFTRVCTSFPSKCNFNDIVWYLNVI